MKKYSIFKQFFSVRKECFCFRRKRFIFEQIPDVAQQTNQAFLLGERSDFAKVRTPEIAYNDTVFPEVVNNGLGTSAFVNMYKWEPGQRLFQSLVYRSSFFSKPMVKSDRRFRHDFQFPQTLQYLLRIVIGSVGNFVITPAEDDAFTITTPVVTVNNASGSKFAVFKVFLNMFSSMVAWRNIFTVTQWTNIKVNINGFIDLLRFGSKPARMTDRRSTFFRGGSFFSLIFFERSLKRFGKILFKLGFIIFKFPDSFLKLDRMPVGNGEFKFVDTVSQVIAFSKDMSWVFTIKGNTEISERTIRVFDFFGTASRFAMPHGVSSSKSTKYEPTTSITKIAIQVNNFFSVNEIFLRNLNNLTMETV